MRQGILAFLFSTALAMATAWLISPSTASPTSGSANKARYVLPPTPGSAPFPDCPKIGVIGSRGSGESPSSTDWDLGLGPPALSFALALGKLLPNVEYTYNAPPGYPASSVTTAIFHKDAYIASVKSGKEQLDRLISDQHTKCGAKTKLLLIGYSQGAELTGDAYIAVIGNKTLFPTIAGVVLFGDPLYDHTDSSTMQTALQQRTQAALHHNGSLTVHGLWHVVPPHSFPASTVGKVLSYCLIDDLVCQGTGGNPFSHQHSHYPESGDLGDAAQYFAKSIDAGQPPAARLNWEGTWNAGNNGIGKMVLVQTGNRVTGTYPNEQGRLEGTVSGDTLTGTWSQTPTYEPPKDSGTFVFTMSADAASFEGKSKLGGVVPGVVGGNGDWVTGWNADRMIPGLTKAVAVATIRKWLRQHHPGTTGVTACPGEPIHFGEPYCQSEFRQGNRWWMVYGVPVLSDSGPTMRLTRETSWLRRWSSYSKAVVRCCGAPGIGSANSPFFDWGWLAGQAYQAWKTDHTTSFHAGALDGGLYDELKAIYWFDCTAQNDLVVCTNKLGDSLRYKPSFDLHDWPLKDVQSWSSEALYEALDTKNQSAPMAWRVTDCKATSTTTYMCSSVYAQEGDTRWLGTMTAETTNCANHPSEERSLSYRFLLVPLAANGQRYPRITLEGIRYTQNQFCQ